jgi:hypothetical protein
MEFGVEMGGCEEVRRCQRREEKKKVQNSSAAELKYPNHPQNLSILVWQKEEDSSRYSI